MGIYVHYPGIIRTIKTKILQPNFTTFSTQNLATNLFTPIQGFKNMESCLDHVISNVPEKCSLPEISVGGDSDHMAIVVTKFRREVKVMPKTVKKRNYKNFNAEAFLNDVLNSKHLVYLRILLS